MSFSKKMHPGFSNARVSLLLAITAKLMNISRLNEICLHFQKILFNSQYIRAVNYHDVPPDSISTFEKHLNLFKTHFSSVSLSDLENFFSKKSWSKNKPGLIITFDDGFRSHYSIVASLLEKYRFVGWFLVPTDFSEISVNQQMSFTKRHDICFDYNYGNERIAMSRAEINALSQKHVLVSHTRSHMRFCNSVTEDRMKNEIVESKNILEEIIQHDIKCFGWVGGEVDSYCAKAARLIREAGYQFAFMSKSAPINVNTKKHYLHRTFLGPSWPLCIVKMHLAGILDILYYKQRKKIYHRTYKEEF